MELNSGRRREGRKTGASEANQRRLGLARREPGSFPTTTFGDEASGSTYWPRGPSSSTIPYLVPEARLADGHGNEAREKIVTHHPASSSLPVLPDWAAITRVVAMPLLLTGRGFRRDLEQAGALALFAPLEGGFETRLLRRLRAAGYRSQVTSARGLGDPEAFLLRLHGVRPPHLGHQSIGRGAAVGEVQRVMPQLGPQFEADGPVLLWLLEGQVLSTAELASLCSLCSREPRLFMVVEMGGARALRWQPLSELVAAA